MPAPAHQTKLAVNILLASLLLAAAAEFAVRGPLRFAHAPSFNDFISPYIQTREWLRGEDPYSPNNLVAHWPPEAEHFVFLTRDLADGTLVLKRGIPTAYPPTSFVLLAPIAILPWHIAHPLWLLITISSFAITVAALASIARLNPRTHQFALFLAIALALAPFHTALAAGSIVTVAVAASAAHLWAASRRHDLLAGLLLAIALSLKPQIGAPFLLYCLIRRRWRIAATAVAVPALLLAIALARLVPGHTPWFQSYLYDNRILFAPGSLGDFTEADPLRFGLINFQLPAYTLLHSRDTANLVAIALACTAALIWFFLIIKRNATTAEKMAGQTMPNRTPLAQNTATTSTAAELGFRNFDVKNFDVKNFDARNFDLLALSAIVTISLLPVYHRFYDATLLIFPLAWAFTALQTRSSDEPSSNDRAPDGRLVKSQLDCGSRDRRLRRIAKAALVVILIVFLFPGGTILQQLQQSGHFAALQTHWWWNSLILPHESWSILILAALLLRAVQGAPISGGVP